MYNLGLSAILCEIISSDAWWIVCNVSCTLGLSATSQGMLPMTYGVQEMMLTITVVFSCDPNPITATDVPLVNPQ